MASGSNGPAGFSAFNINATIAGQQLRAGVYGMDVHATFGGGTVTLDKLAFNGGQFGTTWVPVLTFSADGYQTALLGPGTYRFGVTTATGVYAVISRIPYGD